MVPYNTLGGVHRKDHTTQGYRPTDHTTQGYCHTVSVTHISYFGVISKCHTLNKWRLIINLSHPAGHSVNDSIPNKLRSLSYMVVDTTIWHILYTGPCRPPSPGNELERRPIHRYMPAVRAMISF